MMIKLKSPEISGLFNSHGAGGRTRTDMGRESPLDFESSAYTNFATPAFPNLCQQSYSIQFLLILFKSMKSRRCHKVQIGNVFNDIDGSILEVQSLLSDVEDITSYLHVIESVVSEGISDGGSQSAILRNHSDDC